MKKKIIVLPLLVLIIAACFIPVTRQKTVSIKWPFITVYRELILPANWAKWRPDLRKDFTVDSSEMNIGKGNSSFAIRYQGKALNVDFKENAFNINDTWNGNKTYTYTVIPEKDIKRTTVIAADRITLIGYLLSKFESEPLAYTHIDDLKQFMETDSLLYGFKIFRNGVPGSYLIEVKKDVLTKDRFTEAAKMLEILQQYIKAHDVKKVQPIIGQFSPTNKDSTHINVGFYIDKEVKGEKNIIFARMPKGGPLYSIIYNGKFNQRSKAYTALSQYYSDHHYQSAILPFETYLNDKLPVSDTDKVNIKINFSGYF
ncbi:MAG TPA: hypothetical protein VL442_20560 [Mucilaginibacter sp.]|nr:hypothetical protein [Mucilaginibacter sp.]